MSIARILTQIESQQVLTINLRQLQNVFDAGLNGFEEGQHPHSLFVGQFALHDVHFQLCEFHGHEPRFLQNEPLLLGDGRCSIQLIFELSDSPHHHLNLLFRQASI